MCPLQDIYKFRRGNFFIDLAFEFSYIYVTKNERIHCTAITLPVLININ